MTRSPVQHAAAIAAALPELPAQDVPPLDALGRTLVDDVRAPQDSPSFDNSQMDGYAVPAQLLAGGPAPVGPTIPAGTDPAPLYPAGLGGRVAPVMTGAALPPDTAAVVPVERCDPPEFVEAGSVTLPPTTAGEFMRLTGSDMRRGEVLFERGLRVNERVAGASGLMNVHTLPVRARARVIVCTGGEEIGGTGPAQISDANGPLLRALCSTHHIEVAAHVRTSDKPAELLARLRAAVAEHHPTAVITSGGISHGKFEVVRQALEGWFGHVAMQPGGPQGLAQLDGVPVICLPGNPISTLVSFRVFVAPALGEATAEYAAVAAEDLPGLDGRERFLRGVVHSDDGQLRARAVGGTSSHLLAQSVTANALLRVPAGTTVLAGELLRALPL